MGYYPEVAMVLTQNAVEIMRDKIKDCVLDVALTAERLLLETDTHNIEHESHAELFHWSHIKWYQEFEEINCIEKILEELDDDEYLFIRIGEEITDVETQGSYWHNPFGLDLIRCVEFILDKSTIPVIAEEEKITVAETTETAEAVNF